MRLSTPLPALLLAAAAAASKVPLEIHIMSQCPDARDCYEKLLYPALPSISSLVDFKISFIGTVTSAGVECKHGPHECLGNTLHLCSFQQSSPPAPNLEFTRCLLADYKQVANETYVRECASGAGVDFDELNKCASDIGEGGGLELLQESVERSRKAGITYSCTVRVEEKVWCVRDSGEWKQCGEHGGSVEALVEEVKRVHEERGRNGWELRKREVVGGLKQRAKDIKIDWM